MSVDPLWLFLSLFPGGIGFVLFTVGRKRGNWREMASGVLFLIYPYFTGTVSMLIGVGVALAAATWLAESMEW